jgi:hypothetical protein
MQFFSRSAPLCAHPLSDFQMSALSLRRTPLSGQGRRGSVRFLRSSLRASSANPVKIASASLSAASPSLRKVPSIPENLRSVASQMFDKLAKLYAATIVTGSRLTVCPVISSWARTRLASRTSSRASCRLARASSIVAPWVFAPGSSYAEAKYPSGASLNTAARFNARSTPRRSNIERPKLIANPACRIC